MGLHDYFDARHATLRDAEGAFPTHARSHASLALATRNSAASGAQRCSQWRIAAYLQRKQVAKTR
ncbi:hypothetical protein QSH39_003890 [Xanthomonas arboricola pv. corylina]|uniref:hypothetical protein n=1 Tax=Xanthomonas arboricola TaxID=56448 RepID=UPI0002FC649C|nr:hypothetical protein [Xanthomonas arboricola]AKU50370.1 hypothetical protein AKJ12_11745 [Xanthomonas arboricola pv. juglandis]KCW98218.1 hypothetical protein DK27_12040 [Xanthomonas arboricola pv. pruni]KOB02459.1 hypothetical protein AE921_05830 [Xanthomonas arboricola]KOB03391.1 hypothetical protein AE920_00190 [Xanthomonas arboricola]KOB08026.1 hypothetical protein AE922_11860 [Xanthomonas arboricola]